MRNKCVTVCCAIIASSLSRMLQARKQRRQSAKVLTGPAGLLSPLNTCPHNGRTKQLIALVHVLQKIENDEACVERERQLSKKPAKATSGFLSLTYSLYQTANSILSVCHWSPRVSPPPNPSHRFTWTASTETIDWENSFVWWVLGLRSRREISLIRVCPTCRKWFLACTNHQVYCSDRCRQKFHATSRDFKEKRRLYMRRFRAIQKLREARAKELVKRKTDIRVR